MSVLQEHQIEVPVHQLIEKAVHLSWNMVTLVPPAIVAQPTNHNEDWHEIRATCWNEALQSTHHLVYFKPVLFYSALGQVGCKGEVGNVMRSDAIVFNHKNSFATRYKIFNNIGVTLIVVRLIVTLLLIPYQLIIISLY